MRLVGALRIHGEIRQQGLNATYTHRGEIHLTSGTRPGGSRSVAVSIFRPTSSLVPTSSRSRLAARASSGRRGDPFSRKGWAPWRKASCGESAQPIHSHETMGSPSELLPRVPPRNAVFHRLAQRVFRMGQIRQLVCRAPNVNANCPLTSIIESKELRPCRRKGVQDELSSRSICSFPSLGVTADDFRRCES